MRRNTMRVAAFVGACVMALTACGGDGDKLSPVAARSAMGLTVYPAYDATDVKPDSTITVNGTYGRLDEVQVFDSTGTVITGEFSEDRTAWVADRRLSPNESYTVIARGTSEKGAAVSQTSRFNTLKVMEKDQTGSNFILPLDGSTVGVAHPVVVQFNHNILNREAVLESLTIETSEEVEGGWYWIDAREVHWRPKEFWPSGTKVTVRENLVGLDMGDGEWGTSRRESSFTIGREQVIKVDVKRRELTVVRDDDVIRRVDVSTGKPGWETRNGTKVIMEKVTGKIWTNEAIDAPENYRLRSSYAMRMTNSGEFLHDATWNNRIGSANTSHGCVGMSLADMRWMYNNTIIGDPVITIGSPKKFTDLWNRYQDWNVDWDQWLTGNFDLSDE
ncbi:L,D-transpeptidase [Sporichthya polymorpha]|uniref:L,D-transpeptidase n=1 Tax=Sporichthya polymorpha TaxID=35751 RepID=UPI001FE056A7|nr:Ig-like domain-containing protein [Sporichthya polymorpha]